MTLKVKIIDCVSSNWYHCYLNSVFDVHDKSRFDFYRVIDTVNNRNLLTDAGHLTRIKQDGLTIRSSHTMPISVDSNKDARFLLEKDVK